VIDGTEVPVFPTPTIGMLGIVDDKSKTMSLDFKEKGQLIYLIGKSVNDISSSEYLYSYHNVKGSQAPYFDLDEELAMQNAVRGLIQSQYISAAHDVADGGLFTALAEMSFPRELGFDIVSDSEIREDAFLFGEAQGRVVVAVDNATEDEFLDFMMESKVPFTLLGHVTQGKMVVDDEHYGFSKDYKLKYDNVLGDLMNN
jgi:phosphoribosylformylglycinamidine synthase